MAGGRVWLYGVTALTTVVTGVLVTATLKYSWYAVQCERGAGEWGASSSTVVESLGVGLWAACRGANGTGRREELCQGVDTVLARGHVPAWLHGARLLATCGVASAGVTCVLMFAFCFLPVSAALGSAHGLGAAGLATAAFCVISLLNGYTGRVELAAGIVSSPMCTATKAPVVFSTGYHLTVLGTVFAGLSGFSSVGARLMAGNSSWDERKGKQRKKNGDGTHIITTTTKIRRRVTGDER